METYQRRKLYRVHLKNISEIKNCRSPQSNIAYPSRLYNFDLGVSPNKNGMKTTKQRSPNKVILANVKRSEQHFMKTFLIQKENFRLSNRIMNVYGSISMCKHEKQYLQHRKIMNMHRKVKQKRVIMYRIYDVTFKGMTPDLTQIFCIYDMSKKSLKPPKIKTKIMNAIEQKIQNEDTFNKTQELPDEINKNQPEVYGRNSNEFYRTTTCTADKQRRWKFPNQNLSAIVTARNTRHNDFKKPELLLSGNIFQLRKSMIKGYKDEKIKIKIVGRVTGQSCLQQTEMVPILHHKQIVGSLIVEMC